MKKIVPLALCALFFYPRDFAQAGVPRPKDQLRPIHAAQILLFQCASLAEVDAMLGRLKDAGVDTVIMRVFQNRFDRFYRFARPRNTTGVYFRTQKAPVVDDLLSLVIPLCRRHGLKIFAWMTTRRCDWLIRDHPDWLDRRYDFKTRKFYPLNKVDLFNPGAEEYLRGLYRDLASNDIDGILFQDDLVYRYTEGYSAQSRKAFQRETALKASPALFYKKIVQRSGKYFATGYTPEFWAWARWKNRSVLRFADGISRAVKEIRPSIKVSLNLYYEAVMDPKNGLAWLAEDFRASLRYDFDYFSIMAYHLQIKKALGLTDVQVRHRLETLATRLTHWLDNPARAMIKIQVRDWKTGRRERGRDLEKIFQAVTSQGETSLAFIPCEKDTPLETIQSYFKRARDVAGNADLGGRTLN